MADFFFFLRGPASKDFRLWSQIAVDKTQTTVSLCSGKILFHENVADAIWLTGLSLLTPSGYLAVGGSYMCVCKNSLSHTLLF